MEEIFWKIFEKTGSISSYLVYSQLKGRDGVEKNEQQKKRKRQDNTDAGGSIAIH